MARSYCRVAAYAAFMTVSSSAFGAETPVANTIEGYLHLKPMASAGVLRAGLLCLPSGFARVTDFVSSETEFQRVLDDVVGSLAASKRAQLVPVRSVHLTALKAKLCARSYGVFGMGDKVSHSGTVQVSFEVETADNGGQPTFYSKSIELEIGKKDARPLRSILALALQKLLNLENP